MASTNTPATTTTSAPALSVPSVDVDLVQLQAEAAEGFARTSLRRLLLTPAERAAAAQTASILRTVYERVLRGYVPRTDPQYVQGWTQLGMIAALWNRRAIYAGIAAAAIGLGGFAYYRMRK